MYAQGRGRGRGRGGGGMYRDDRQGRPSPQERQNMENRRRPPGRGDGPQMKREKLNTPPKQHTEGGEPVREPNREPGREQQNETKREPLSHESPRHQMSPEASRNNPPNANSLSDLDLEEMLHEKKFSYRARLFVANIRDMSQDEFRKMFEPFGEYRECHVVKEKGIGFITMAFRFRAERAIRELDGKEIRGKKLLVRFSQNSEAIEVSHLPDAVSNEFLGDAFSQFGPVAHSVVASDSRGKSLNYGIVFFENRQSVQKAIKACSDNFFLLTASPRPCLVKEYVPKDVEDGVSEAKICRYVWVQRERSVPARFANPESVDAMIAQKWMNLYLAQERKREEFEHSLKEDEATLEKDLKSERDKMENEVRRIDLMRQKEEHLRMLEHIQRQEDILKSTGPQQLLPPMDPQRGLLSGPSGNQTNHAPLGGNAPPPLLPNNPLVPPMQHFPHPVWELGFIDAEEMYRFLGTERQHLPMEPPMHRGDTKPQSFRGQPHRKF